MSVRRPTLFPMLFRPKLLRYLGVTKNHEFSKLIHTRFIVSNQCSQDNIGETNALIGLYSKSEAGALMSGHFQNGFSFEVLRLFKSMVSDHEESCPPNEYISELVLSSCSNVRFLQLGRQCHGYLLKSGLVFNQYVKTALVRLYSMLSDVVGAVEVSVYNHRELDYNMILVGLMEKGYLDEALIILRRMLAEEDIVWSEDTYIGIFGLCARLKDFNLGRQVHNKLLKSDDVESDEYVCSAMISMYGKCGDIFSARKVFEYRCRKSVVIWTAILAAYSEHGFFEESLYMFTRMIYEDVVPNESTFCVLLTLSAELFSLRCVKSVHALAQKTGFKGHKNVEDTLIEMYSRTGDIKAAENVFLGMNYDRDITTWNAMINGYSLHGFGNESLALFQEMLELGEDDPNEETFVGVLSACGHVGLVEKGFYYLYELMKEKGVKPGLVHYRCIINMLIKAGRLSEALSFIVSTPSKWDVVAWTTLLRGCRDHGNYDLGIRVSELIPDDVAIKVSMWCGVRQVGELMEIRDTKEERGVSWVDIDDETYKYPSIEKGHPHFVEFLDLIKLTISTTRCFFDSLGIDVEDELKRDCDDYILGEEIAVAFALFNTHVKAPICIIKSSGKIGGGFHSLMKLLSKATFRLLTVRDAYQFHHFQDGRCSCADYW